MAMQLDFAPRPSSRPSPSPNSLLRRAKTVLGAASCVALWQWPNTATAQAKDPAAARELFQQARKAADANDLETACPKFEESYRLDPAVGTLLNMAECDNRAGRLAIAWAKLQTALEQLPSTDDRRPAVQRVARDLDTRVPKLTIGIKPGTTVECTVMRDNVPIRSGSLGVRLPVDPGHHVVTVNANGRRPQQYDVDLAEGQVVEIWVEPGPSQSTSAAAWPSPAVPITPSASSTSRNAPETNAAAVGSHPQSSPKIEHQSTKSSHTIAYTVGGTGIALVGAGVIARVVAFNKQSTIDAHCPNKVCDDTGWDARRSALTLQTVSTVMLAAGAAALGIGIYLVAAEPGQEASSRVALQSVAIPGGGFASITGAF